MEDLKVKQAVPDKPHSGSIGPATGFQGLRSSLALLQRICFHQSHGLCHGERAGRRKALERSLSAHDYILSWFNQAQALHRLMVTDVDILNYPGVLLFPLIGKDFKSKDTD